MEDEENSKKVAKYIIKNTPIGHLSKALDNLKAIAGNSILENPEVKKEIQVYGENHLSQVQVDLINSKVVISPLNKDANEFYYDQGQGVRFKLKQEGGEVVGAEKITASNDLREEIEKKVKPFIEKYFKKEATKHNVYFDSAANKINVIISSHNLNLKNYWSGEWLSTWEMDMNSKNVNGVIKANTYYYEEGNVQFNIETKFETTIGASEKEEIAEELVKFIEDSENTMQRKMEKIYETFSDSYIKPLRRNLPVTGTKMNWNLNQVQVNQ